MRGRIPQKYLKCILLLFIFRIAIGLIKTFISIQEEYFGADVEWVQPDVLKVLVWTKHFGRRANKFRDSTPEDCPVKCQFTIDREHLPSADAVYFQSQTIERTDFPSYRLDHQIWIYSTRESPIHTRQDLPSFSNVFNWTMTYRADSDISFPYGKIVPIPTDFNQNNKPLEILSNKSKLVAWVVSNCHTNSDRQGIVDKLKEYIAVDIYGKCGDHQCRRDGDGCFPEIEKNYKFYLSFENSLCSEYVTEKLFDNLNRSIVPIVYGGANYTAIAPPGSFINVRDFTSTEKLAKYLHFLDTNPEEYLKYFRWKKDYQVIRLDASCTICTVLSRRDRSMRKWYTDLWRWFHFMPDPNVLSYEISYSYQSSLENVVNRTFKLVDKEPVVAKAEGNMNLVKACYKPLEIS